MGKMSTWGWVVAALLVAPACAHRSSKKIEPVAEGAYRIGREDALDISVWRDPDLSRTLPVRPDGYVTLPIAGEVKAAGKTTEELAKELRAKLAPFVQEPRVTVMVREANSSRVFVTGEVAHPGAYPLRGRISLLQALALAGGLSDFANADGILVIRQGETGSENIPVRYSDLVAHDDDRRAEFLLRPGDTVVVP
jgi:polysaccharide export outer membrane protein